MISTAHINKGSVILDVGCGNGKMVEYIVNKTNATAYGFDYSQNAIDHAYSRTKSKQDKLIFQVGLIDEIAYANNFFDQILSVDTMYFTNDMVQLVNKIYNWLKPNGTFIAYYSEGHLSKKTTDENNTQLAIALKQLNIEYEVIDYTKNHFELMKHKRLVAENMKSDFANCNLEDYYDAAIGQSISNDMTFEEFKKTYNRYMYIVKKTNQ